MAEAGALELSEVSLNFGGLQVIDALSLALRRGELLALIGPNGAGKTSVLNCISGIYRPAGGRIRFEGREITGWAPHAVARAGIGRTFQHAELFPRMTVLENILIGRHTRIRTHPLLEGLFLGPVAREEAAHRARVEEILELVELQRYRKRPVAALSFGVQKLVGFARVLAMEPRLMLLDEPSAGLNREEREDLARFILRIKHESGIGMLWIEHDMQMVADLADRVVVVDRGRLVAEGPPAAVLAEPRVAEIYLGRAGRPGQGTLAGDEDRGSR